MQKFVYYLFLVFVYFLKIIPFALLYAIADFVYFLLYKVISYRKEVVYNNLKGSFPDKPEEEIKKIEKAFFKHLSMILVESVKGFSMTAKQIQARYKVLNKEVADKYFEQGRSVIALAAHYANWEWAIDALAVQNHKVKILYKPLQNKYIDDYLKKKRSHAGINLVSIANTRRMFNEKTEPSMYVFAGDQNPASGRKAIWVDFLNRDTACVHGPEFYTRFTEAPVVYMDFKRVKKGFYTLEFIDLGDELWKTEKGKITELYMKTLEKEIRKQPELWLWSHKRWKRKRNKQTTEALK